MITDITLEELKEDAVLSETRVVQFIEDLKKIEKRQILLKKKHTKKGAYINIYIYDVDLSRYLLYTSYKIE